jgi:putative transposase
MRRTFQYRIYPTKKQARVLDSQLEECRWLYNQLIEQRKTSYELTKTSLNIVNAQILQNVAVRVDLAYQAFFRRLREQPDEKPGYPRFKGKFRYHSMTFPQLPSTCEIRDGFLRVSKVGSIKIVLHRKLEGKPKTCTIKKETTGKWFASFSCEVQKPEPLPYSTEEVGIDVGLSTFASFSNGEKIKRRRFFKQDQKELAKVQRKFEKETKGTPERRRRRLPIARVHERIANRRQDFVFKSVRKVIDRYGFIAVEDLEVNRMREDPKYAKGIADTAWSMFFTLLFVKAAEAGRICVRANPAYTTQTCSNCGHRKEMPVNKRIYSCPNCSLEICRDHNAAINILKLGLGLHAVGYPNSRSP